MDNDYGAWLPNTDDAREKAKLAEQQNLKASVPVLQDVLDWFDTQIAAFKNPEIIEGVNVSTPAEQVKLAALFAQTNIASYRQKRMEFEQRFSEYLISEVEQTE